MWGKPRGAAHPQPRGLEPLAGIGTRFLRPGQHDIQRRVIAIALSGSQGRVRLRLGFP